MTPDTSMITHIVIPQAFENMEEATVGAWLKAEGDAVQNGDALCELITEKTTFQLPAEGSGVLRRIVAAEKSIVPVGFIIGLIGDPEEPLPDIEAHNAGARESKRETPDTPAETLRVPSVATPSYAPSVSGAAVGAAPSGASAASRVRATPAARRAARERGVALEDVAAAFPGKVLSEDDVANFQP